MAGNASEWVQDWFDFDYYSQSPMTDPPGPQQGGSRVNRGGSWDYVAEDCRSALRGGRGPGLRGGSLGFRLAFSPGPDQTGQAPTGGFEEGGWRVETD
jgi:formylglycine-generating enzyme required for sulfatase activity